MTHTVTLHFDFVSPYSWLALMQVEEFGRRFGVQWVIRPVVYAALLDAAELVGPAEVPAKREYTAFDVHRCAHRLGLRPVGPPEHPFRSIEALRVACLHQDDPGGLRLAVRIADACWSDGQSLTDLAVLQEIVAATGFEAVELGRRIARPEVKNLLRTNTERAIARGVFGVPSFIHDDELYWGHDRLSHLADRLLGRGPDNLAAVRQMLSRPRGADRKRFR